jgi:hypothetical protein
MRAPLSCPPSSRRRPAQHRPCSSRLSHRLAIPLCRQNTSHHLCLFPAPWRRTQRTPSPLFATSPPPGKTRWLRLPRPLRSGQHFLPHPTHTLHPHGHHWSHTRRLHHAPPTHPHPASPPLGKPTQPTPPRPRLPPPVAPTSHHVQPPQPHCHASLNQRFRCIRPTSWPPKSHLPAPTTLQHHPCHRPSP